MDVTETILEGTIQPDGTLILDGPTGLPAGRVQVVVRTPSLDVSNSAADEFLQMLRDFEASKIGEGTASQSIAERQAIQNEMEQELEEAARLQRESRQRRAEADRAGQ